MIGDGKAARAGAEVHLLVGRGMIHTFWDCPEAMGAFEAIELFIGRKPAL